MRLSKIQIAKFQETIWEYYKANGRDLPWRRTDDPYRIFISEVMLQQTQVGRVIPKYEALIARLPDFASLARASTATVLSLWHGLGYNRRALSLQKSSQIITHDHGGILPNDRAVLETLPGIGKGTSGSLLAFAYNRPEPFIETNIRRVCIHFFFKDQEQVHDDDILEVVAQTLDAKRPKHWYYALMDYGSMLPKAIATNPNRKSKHYTKQSKFEGSKRQIRGKILALLLNHKSLSETEIINELATTDERIGEVLSDLVTEGFINKTKTKFSIKK